MADENNNAEDVAAEGVAVEAEAATEAETVGRNALDRIAEVYFLEGVEYHCTASIGVALFKNHLASQDEILNRADTAMYEAKAAGRDQVRFSSAAP